MILPEEFTQSERIKTDRIELKMPPDLKRVDVCLFNQILLRIGFTSEKKFFSYYHHCSIYGKKIIIRHKAFNNGMILELFIDRTSIYKTNSLSIKDLEVQYLSFLPFLISKINEIIRENDTND